MADLDDELALFESEINQIAASESEPQADSDVTSSSVAPQLVSSGPSSICGTVVPPMSAVPNAFLPPQLRTHIPPPMAPLSAQNTHMPMGAFPMMGSSSSSGIPTVLASGPVRNVPGPSGSSSQATIQGAAEEYVYREPTPEPQVTMALPSDVDAMQAKRMAALAHKNSYLGQVERGEKKMRRFYRCAGGQVWEDPSMIDWDPNDFRIFCGDLGNECTDELLAKAFRKYPSFQKAKVVRDGRTNKPKGYGFVSFKVQDDFVRAMREMDGKYVGNRPIKLRKSQWKDRQYATVAKKQKQKGKLGLA